MIKSNIDFFKFVNNFKKNEDTESNLIVGEKSSITPLISFIIPTYKSKTHLLKEAVDSALNQYDFTNYEILIIDNNPELNCTTTDLIKSYKSEKIYYYKNTRNIGMFGNWNRGVELSRSSWIVLLHDDDIVSPYFLKSCFCFLRDESIAIIKPQNTIFSNSNDLSFFKPERVEIERLNLIDFIWGCAVGAPTNIIYNKNILLNLGGFNQGYFPAADYVLSINCAYKYKVYSINSILGGYRIGENESLKSETMKLYYINRLYITTFIMRFYRLPYFLIEIIQSSLMDKLISDTNTFYKTNFEFNYYSELDIKKKNKYLRYIFVKFYKLFSYALIIRRKLVSIIYYKFLKVNQYL